MDVSVPISILIIVDLSCNIGVPIGTEKDPTITNL